jgi:hypothetical protein
VPASSRVSSVLHVSTQPLSPLNCPLPLDLGPEYLIPVSSTVTLTLLMPIFLMVFCLPGMEVASELVVL